MDFGSLAHHCDSILPSRWNYPDPEHPEPMIEVERQYISVNPKGNNTSDSNHKQTFQLMAKDLVDRISPPGQSFFLFSLCGPEMQVRNAHNIIKVYTVCETIDQAKNLVLHWSTANPNVPIYCARTGEWNTIPLPLQTVAASDSAEPQRVGDTDNNWKRLLISYCAPKGTVPVSSHTIFKFRGAFHKKKEMKAFMKELLQLDPTVEIFPGKIGEWIQLQCDQSLNTEFLDSAQEMFLKISNRGKYYEKYVKTDKELSQIYKEMEQRKAETEREIKTWQEESRKKLKSLRGIEEIIFETGTIPEWMLDDPSDATQSEIREPRTQPTTPVVQETEEKESKEMEELMCMQRKVGFEVLRHDPSDDGV